MSIAKAPIFCGLLDNLTKQFMDTKSARCTGAQGFNGQLPKDAQDFFSVTIECADLGDKDILGVLVDDAVNGEAYTFTFMIFINCGKFNELQLIFALAAILSHEICHFAFFYELFMNEGGTLDYTVYTFLTI